MRLEEIIPYFEMGFPIRQVYWEVDEYIMLTKDNEIIDQYGEHRLVPLELGNVWEVVYLREDEENE